MSDDAIHRSQVERYAKLSPAEQDAFDRMDGGELRRLVNQRQPSGRRYDPYDTSEWSAQGPSGPIRGWRTIDGNHFAAMRQYYGGHQHQMPDGKPPVVFVDIDHKRLDDFYGTAAQGAGIYTRTPGGPMLALPAGPQPFGELTQYASC